MRLADGVLLVVDVLEGVGAATERAIQQAVAEGLAITLLISKVRVCLLCCVVLCARAHACVCCVRVLCACAAPIAGQPVLTAVSQNLQSVGHPPALHH